MGPFLYLVLGNVQEIKSACGHALRLVPSLRLNLAIAFVGNTWIQSPNPPAFTGQCLVAQIAQIKIRIALTGPCFQFGTVKTTLVVPGGGLAFSQAFSSSMLCSDLSRSETWSRNIPILVESSDLEESRCAQGEFQKNHVKRGRILPKTLCDLSREPQHVAGTGVQAKY